MHRSQGYAHFCQMDSDAFDSLNSIYYAGEDQSQIEQLRCEYLELVRRKNFGGYMFSPTHILPFYSCIKNFGDESVFSLYHKDSDQVFEFMKNKENQLKLFLRYDMYSKNCIPFEDEFPFPVECFHKFDIIPEQVDITPFICEGVNTHFDTSKRLEENTNSPPVSCFDVITNEQTTSDFKTVVNGNLLTIKEFPLETYQPKGAISSIFFDKTMSEDSTNKVSNENSQSLSAPTTPFRFTTARQSPLVHDHSLVNHRRGQQSNVNLRDQIVQLKLQNQQLQETINRLQDLNQANSNIVKQLEQEIAENAQYKDEIEKLKQHITQIYQEKNWQFYKKFMDKH